MVCFVERAGGLMRFQMLGLCAWCVRGACVVRAWCVHVHARVCVCAALWGGDGLPSSAFRSRRFFVAATCSQCPEPLDLLVNIMFPELSSSQVIIFVTIPLLPAANVHPVARRISDLRLLVDVAVFVKGIFFRADGE